MTVEALYHGGRRLVDDRKSYRGKDYFLVGTRDHVDRKGRPMTLLVWHGECSRCGAGFTFTLAPTKAAKPRLRCKVCKP